MRASRARTRVPHAHTRTHTRVSGCSTQESGRAGRDLRPSTCVLYYNYGDAAKSRHMIRQSAQENGAPEEQVRSNMESLNAMVRRPTRPPWLPCLHAPRGKLHEHRLAESLQAGTLCRPGQLPASQPSCQAACLAAGIGW